MTPRQKAAVADLRDASRLLRAQPNQSAISAATAALLDAQAKHWSMWFPASPLDTDRAFIELSRAIHSQPPAQHGPSLQSTNATRK